MAYIFLSNPLWCTNHIVMSQQMLAIIISSHWSVTKLTHCGIWCMRILEMLFGQIPRTEWSITCTRWTMFDTRKLPFYLCAGINITDANDVIIVVLTECRCWRIIVEILKFVFRKIILEILMVYKLIKIQRKVEITHNVLIHFKYLVRRDKLCGLIG